MANQPATIYASTEFDYGMLAKTPDAYAETIEEYVIDCGWTGFNPTPDVWTLTSDGVYECNGEKAYMIWDEISNMFMVYYID